MKTSWVGFVGLLCANALPIDAAAQESGRGRNQSLQEQIKVLEVRTNVASASTQSAPKTNDVESGLTQKSRPVVIEGPGYYRGMSSAPSNR